MVESNEMIGRINQTQSKSIKVIDRTIEVNRTQSKIYIFFRLWLISIVRSINSIVRSSSIDHFDCSIDHFDWVQSIRTINSIAFDWVRSIRSTIEFDCVRLTSPGIQSEFKISGAVFQNSRNSLGAAMTHSENWVLPALNTTRRS